MHFKKLETKILFGEQQARNTIEIVKTTHLNVTKRKKYNILASAFERSHSEKNVPFVLKRRETSNFSGIGCLNLRN